MVEAVEGGQLSRRIRAMEDGAESFEQLDVARQVDAGGNGAALLPREDGLRRHLYASGDFVEGEPGCLADRSTSVGVGKTLQEGCSVDGVAVFWHTPSSPRTPPSSTV